MTVDDTPTASPTDIGMTIKQMVTELYGDMKVVRPAVELLSSQNLDGRLRVQEQATIDQATSEKVAKAVSSAFFSF